MRMRCKGKGKKKHGERSNHKSPRMKTTFGEEKSVYYEQT